jgi:hypothetical protein
MPTTSPANASSASCAVLRKEEHCGVLTAHRLAGARLSSSLHAPAEPPGADAQEGDAVAVVRVHVRLDLEDEAGERGSLAGSHACARSPAGARGGGARGRPARRADSRTPKLLQRRCRRTPASAGPSQEGGCDRTAVQASAQRSSTSKSAALVGWPSSSASARIGEALDWNRRGARPASSRRRTCDLSLRS